MLCAKDKSEVIKIIRNDLINEMRSYDAESHTKYFPMNHATVDVLLEKC